MGRSKEGIKDGYGHFIREEALLLEASSLIVLMASWVGGGPQL